MIIYELKNDCFEIKAAKVCNTNDIENAFINSDFGGATILKTGEEITAVTELKKYKSTAYKTSDIARSVINGDIYYVEKYEATPDGDFISGSDFIFAEWSEEVKRCFTATGE